MKILALDIATTTGYSSSSGESGTFNCSFKKGESGSIRLLRFRNKVTELLDLIKPDIVAYERSAGRNTHSIKTQSEMIGVLTLMLEDRNIHYASYSPSDWKNGIFSSGFSFSEFLTSFSISSSNSSSSSLILSSSNSSSNRKAGIIMPFSITISWAFVCY